MIYWIYLGCGVLFFFFVWGTMTEEQREEKGPLTWFISASLCTIGWPAVIAYAAGESLRKEQADNPQKQIRTDLVYLRTAFDLLQIQYEDSPTALAWLKPVATKHGHKIVLDSKSFLFDEGGYFLGVYDLDAWVFTPREGDPVKFNGETA